MPLIFDRERSRLEELMKTRNVILSLGVFLIAGCAKEEAPSWEEVQFKVSLRSEAYKAGDTIPSGEFEDLVVVSLLIRIKRGPGETHTVQEGVWLHVAWDDVRLEHKPCACLVFEGFRILMENRFCSPYGTSWWDNGWQDRGRISISEEWNSFQTSIGIDPSGDDPRIWCKMWRWVRNSPKPDIALGQKQEREPTTSTDG